MLNIKEVLIQWFIIFLLKGPLIQTKEEELILIWLLKTKN